jgi:hypothetical protein
MRYIGINFPLPTLKNLLRFSKYEDCQILRALKTLLGTKTYGSSLGICMGTNKRRIA